MQCEKITITRYGDDPRAKKKDETGRFLASYELEVTLIVNGWRVNRRNRYIYTASRFIKDENGDMQRQKISVNLYHVNVSLNDGPPVLIQLIKKFNYYDWFDR